MSKKIMMRPEFPLLVYLSTRQPNSSARGKFSAPLVEKKTTEAGLDFLARRWEQENRFAGFWSDRPRHSFSAQNLSVNREDLWVSSSDQVVPSLTVTLRAGIWIIPLYEKALEHLAIIYQPDYQSENGFQEKVALWGRDLRDVFAALWAEIPGEVGLKTDFGDDLSNQPFAAKSIPLFQIALSYRLLNSPLGANISRLATLAETIETGFSLWCRIQGWIKK